MNPLRKIIHYYALPFQDKSLERAYLDHVFESSLVNIRIGMIAALFALAAFIPLDYLLFPQSATTVVLIRLVFIIPLQISIIFASFFPIFKRIWHPYIFILLMGQGLAHILMMMLANSSEPGQSLYYGGVLAVIIAGHGILRHRSAYASMVGGLIIVTYILALVITPAITRNSFPTLFINTALAHIAFLVTIHILGMFISFYMEKTWRLLFVKNKQIQQKNEQQEKTNAELRRVNKVMVDNLKLAEAIQKPIGVSFDEADQLLVGLVYKPYMHVNGDLFLVRQLSPNKIRVFLADTVGHGVQAALLSMLVVHEYERICPIFDYPREIITQLNNAFIDQFSHLTLIFTCIVIDLDIEKQLLRYCSAGHPEQYLFKGSILHRLPPTDKLVGITESYAPKEGTIRLEPDFTLVLFTDGLYEQEDEQDEPYGIDRLESLLDQISQLDSEEIAEQILLDISHFRGQTVQADDMTCAVIKPTDSLNRQLLRD
jgi:serine phosphatase RsbU (regulator of sigma subunit)